MKVDASYLWMFVREWLSNLPGEDQWETDTLWLAANWNYCYLDGKHPLTTKEEWEILDEIMKNSVYTEKDCKRLFDLLCEKRIELYVKLCYELETE